jgi:hypothetical protein
MMFSFQFVQKLREFSMREGVLVRDFGEIREATLYVRNDGPNSGRGLLQECEHRVPRGLQ